MSDILERLNSRAENISANAGYDHIVYWELMDAASAISSLRSQVEELQRQLDEQAKWPKLDKPALVGAGRFGIGVSSELVVRAAQRHYEYEVTPGKEAARIAKAGSIFDTESMIEQARAEEREACAKAVEDTDIIEAKYTMTAQLGDAFATRIACADAIRARGEKK